MSDFISMIKQEMLCLIFTAIIFLFIFFFLEKKCDTKTLYKVAESLKWVVFFFSLLKIRDGGRRMTELTCSDEILTRLAC